jgi:hypothetical protein
MSNRILATAPSIAMSISSASAASTDDRLKKLHELYQCPVFAYLVAIHRTPLNYDNRYLIVTIEHRIDERFYAQCAFENQDRRMHCEISSPFFNAVMKPYFKGDRLTLIKALGYRSRHKDNYYQKRDAQSFKSLYEIAGLLIDTLGRVFDMEADEGLKYEAPLVKQAPDRGVEGSSLCAPLTSAK